MVGCLISPITWIHHLVWVGPAILLLLDSALATQDRRRAVGCSPMVFCTLLCSRLVWDFAADFGGLLTWPLSNAYVWISIALLVLLPIRQPAGRDSPDPPAESPRLAPLGTEGESHVGELDREFAGLLDGVRAPAAVRSKPVPVVKAERPGVGR